MTNPQTQGPESPDEVDEDLDPDLDPWEPSSERHRLIHLAVLSGQSFHEMLAWHPRDVDTLEQHYRNLNRAAEEAASQQRFAAMRAAVNAGR